MRGERSGLSWVTTAFWVMFRSLVVQAFLVAELNRIKRIIAQSNYHT